MLSSRALYRAGLLLAAHASACANAAPSSSAPAPSPRASSRASAQPSPEATNAASTPPPVPSDVPPLAPEPRATAKAKSLAVGGGRGCAVLVDGALSCWGSHRIVDPRRIAGVSGVAEVVLGMEEALVVTDTGTIGVVSRYPNGFDAITDAVDADYAPFWRCVLRKTGTVACAQTWRTSRPIRVPALLHATAIDIGQTHGCAIVEGGSVSCFPLLHKAGRPGRAKAVPNVANAVAISVGAVLGCVRRADDTVACFELQKPNKQLIDGGTASALAVSDYFDGSPTPLLCRAKGKGASCHFISVHERKLADEALFNVEGKRPIVEIAPSYGNLCVLDDRGEVRCVGSNQNGMLARPWEQSTPTPIEMKGLPPMRSVVLERDWLCGASRASEVWCSESPTRASKVAGFSHPVAKLVELNDLYCGFSPKGAVSCFGIEHGVLAPVERVPGLDGVIDLTMSLVVGSNVAAITADGHLAYTLVPRVGELGTLSLTQVSGPSNFKRVLAPPMSRDTTFGPLRGDVIAFDEKDQAHVLRFEYEKPVSSLLRAPRRDGVVAVHHDNLLLMGNGDIWHDDPKLKSPVFAKTRFTELLTRHPCGITRDGRAACIDPLSRLGSTVSYDEVMGGVTSAAAYDEGICAVDGQGKVWCWSDTTDLTGAAKGTASSNAPLLIPLQ